MQQISFDFNRADQLGMLRDIEIPCIARLRGSTTKSVLRAIDDFARKDSECFASESTLAKAVGCGERTVKRAVSHLVRLSFVTCTRKRNRYGIVTNHYRIVWTELSLWMAKCAARKECGHDHETIFVNMPAPAELVLTNGPSNGPRQDTNGPRQDTNGPCGRTNGPWGPTNGPCGTDQRAMVAPKAYLTEKEPPPTEVTWVVVVEELISFGVAEEFAQAAALSVRELQRSPEDVRLLIDHAKRHNLGPGLVSLIVRGRKPWPKCVTDPVPSVPKPRPVMSSEDQFRAGLRRHLLSQGVRGEALIEAVDAGVARWRAEQIRKSSEEADP